MNLAAGKVMGGTSKINAGMYTRGVPGEWEELAEKGRNGWGWEEVKKAYVKSEKSLTWEGEHRGREGLFFVCAVNMK